MSNTLPKEILDAAQSEALTYSDKVDKVAAPYCDFMEGAVFMYSLLTTPTQGVGFAESVERVSNESEGGIWQSCTGCHETVDGQETGHYPYSEIFKCYVGAGCHECGGIGVVWNDYSDYENKPAQGVEERAKECPGNNWRHWEIIPENFAEYHIRYAADGLKLDTDLFVLAGNALFKHGRCANGLVPEDIQWLDESGASSLQADLETFKDAYAERNEKVNALQAENEKLKESYARLMEGRHYLMGVNADKITVEDALEAFGFGRNGLNF
jgi:hypothetical protein